jgi:hypothetical protein
MQIEVKVEQTYAGNSLITVRFQGERCLMVCYPLVLWVTAESVQLAA